MSIKKGAVLNYTTEVPVIKTLAEIEKVLVVHGASAVVKEYQDGGIPRALEFDIKTKFGLRTIRLPANSAAVYKILAGDGYWPDRKKEQFRNQAQRVAWRIVLRWVEANMALIQTEMVDLSEVFLPYMVTSGGKTMYQLLLSRNLELPAPVEAKQ